MTGCRICTANDLDALAEEIAEEIWNTVERSSRDDEWRPWADAGPYWQGMMRVHAKAVLRVARGQHAGSVS